MSFVLECETNNVLTMGEIYIAGINMKVRSDRKSGKGKSKVGMSEMISVGRSWTRS